MNSEIRGILLLMGLLLMGLRSPARRSTDGICEARSHRSGVSRICLGCMSCGVADRGNHAWSIDEAESRPFIQRALEGGIAFFDTANRYSLGSSEEILGRAIRDFARRDEVVIATKVYGRMRPGPNGGGLSRKAIMIEILASWHLNDLIRPIYRIGYYVTRRKALEGCASAVSRACADRRASDRERRPREGTRLRRAASPTPARRRPAMPGLPRSRSGGGCAGRRRRPIP
jgi:Aldo/keto reductase family